MNNPILSICIPTRNRAQILERSLTSIVNQVVFMEGDEVEIIISDNCSDDNTYDVVKQFLDAYPGKIFYYRNERNVGADSNLEIVLKHAKGLFLKLQNDSVGFNPGGLGFFLEEIKSASIEKYNIFLLNHPLHTGSDFYDCQDLPSLLSYISYNSTWMGSFGIWREDFQLMTNFSRAYKKRLVQTDVLFQLANKGKLTRVIGKNLLFNIDVDKKGGYSLSTVFGKNYLSILYPYVESEVLTKDQYLIEKKKIFINIILPYYFNDNHDFNKYSFFEGLEDYYNEDYFYPEIEKFFLSYIEKNPSREDLKPNVTSLWRILNPHNKTRIEAYSNYKKISVGRATYGNLKVHDWDDAKEGLNIGSFVSIGDDVTFLLGGEHPYKGLSTYPFKVKYFGAKEEAISRGKITIGDDVWIGYGALIMSGVSIGQGAIIGAKSVVTRDVEPYSIVVGSPAKHIKYRFDDEIINILLKLDFARITDEKIYSLKEGIYDELTVEKARLLVDYFMGDHLADMKYEAN